MTMYKVGLKIIHTLTVEFDVLFISKVHIGNISIQTNTRMLVEILQKLLQNLSYKTEDI